ncbi:MAG TPA: ABC transporter substrate-binding protein [Candidatus Binatia bacterium]|nr:ABC transporter substrate-binding protein [Candidatus Binatia bacterium]
MKAKILVYTLPVLILATIHLASAQQQGKAPRIGFLAPTSGPGAFYELFRQGLRELGYVDGKNVLIEYRSAEDRSQLVKLASELAQLKVDVIVTPGLTIAAAMKATATVPIIFSFSGDPVEAGFVSSLARPGGNLTGITWLAFELVGKRLELLKEAVPGVSRVGVLANPAHPGEQRELKETQTTARALGTTLQYYQVKAANDFNAAFDAVMNDNANAIVVFPDALTFGRRTQIAEFAMKRRLPSVFAWKEYVEVGGLMSYGPEREETLRRLAVYVDKILKGRKPADLPVEQPSKFEFVINLKTAKQIGVTIPPNVLARADKVIR